MFNTATAKEFLPAGTKVLQFAQYKLKGSSGKNQIVGCKTTVGDAKANEILNWEQDGDMNFSE
jgi:hypothetical protein